MGPYPSGSGVTNRKAGMRLKLMLLSSRIVPGAVPHLPLRRCTMLVSSGIASLRALRRPHTSGYFHSPHCFYFNHSRIQPMQTMTA